MYTKTRRTVEYYTERKLDYLSERLREFENRLFDENLSESERDVIYLEIERLNEKFTEWNNDISY